MKKYQAVALAGVIALTSTNAEAWNGRWHNRGGHHNNHHNYHGGQVAGAIAGVALAGLAIGVVANAMTPDYYYSEPSFSYGYAPRYRYRYYQPQPVIVNNYEYYDNYPEATIVTYERPMRYYRPQRVVYVNNY